MTTPAPGAVFPRLMTAVAAGLALLVVGTASSRLLGTPTQVPTSQAVAERQLDFEDLADGAIVVRDASSGQRIATLVGQNGFLRATVRGLAQQRKREDNEARTPFRLTAWADDRLTLDDPVTGRHVELEAFGETNEAVFAQLLVAKESVD